MLEPAIELIRRNKKTKEKRLDIGRCGLSSLPEELFDCIWLEELIVSNEYLNVDWIQSSNGSYANSISSIPSAIKNLAHLKILRIGGNFSYPWAITDVNALKHLSLLEELDLTANNISSISALSSLKNLRQLRLAGNAIVDVTSLASLTMITHLDLSSNKISNWAPIANLPNLTLLNLCDNLIFELKLSDLEHLRLFLNLDINTRSQMVERAIYFSGNSIGNIPPEVFKQGEKFVLQYLKSQNKVPLNECKVIITGRGAVGKTSLQKRLFGDEAFNPYESETHGIRKRTWDNATLAANIQPIKIHFWDMGGQQEQQTLHQLFYTDNAVYILLLDKRVDEDPEYFLELIKVYGNSSPVIVVINQKIDLNSETHVSYNLSPDFDSTLRDKYSNIKKIFGVCCGQVDDPGISALRKYLIDFIPSLDHVREKFPVEWLAIKNELLSKIDRNYINFEEYQKLCIAKELRVKELQVGLAKMLNNTGAITYFDKPYLHYYILNPDWVTTGAYEIILSPVTAKKGGRITFKDLKLIFNEKLLFNYTEGDYEFLMKLMLAYSLCHEFKETQEWLIPSSLKGQPITNLVKFKEQEDYRLFCLKFKTSLPQSIIYKFIARNIDYAYKQDYWRNGIVVKHTESDTILFSEADYKEKEIRVWIKGKQILEAWKFFRKDFIDLSSKFEYEEMIEIEGKNNAMMSYKELTNLYRALRKEELENWYNPNLNLHVNVIRTLAMIDDDIGKDKVLAPLPLKEQDLQARENDLEKKRKDLEFQLLKLERDQENGMVKNWKKKAIQALVVSIIITVALYLIYLTEPDFVMRREGWAYLKRSNWLSWIGAVTAWIWNSIVIKLYYDRIYDPSKEKAFRDQLKSKAGS